MCVFMRMFWSFTDKLASFCNSRREPRRHLHYGQYSLPQSGGWVYRFGSTLVRKSCTKSTCHREAHRLLIIQHSGVQVQKSVLMFLFLPFPQTAVCSGHTKCQLTHSQQNADAERRACPLYTHCLNSQQVIQ